MFTGPFAEHVALWESVVGQAIGAMRATGHFAHGVQTGEGSGAPGVGAYAATEEVRFRSHEKPGGTIVELLCVHNVCHIWSVAPEGCLLDVLQRHDHGVV